jgi:alkyl sulfatase BDS1-like metallo-beta-lactamase superfamily hydrolase
VYTHGHIDHVFGTGVFEEESAEKGWPAARVVGHEDVDPRFDRYILTAGYNSVINQRQFRAPGLQWPLEYRRPDVTYRESLDVEVGGTAFECHHARGETDDHTWAWLPERRVACVGDLFIWNFPNAGNPQKVQRYPEDWARALRSIIARQPELLLPAHGLPIEGRERIAAVLDVAATALEALVRDVLAMMNSGAALDEIIHTVTVDDAVLRLPYMRPLYDEPEFVIRNVWRRYGGWWDGNPASLKPAPHAVLAGELASLAGGASRLASRAVEVADGGDLRLACHLIELAAAAAPEDIAVHAARADLYERRRHAETSLMTKGIFAAAARESRQVVDPDG